MTSQEYWKKREEEALKHYITDEAEYKKHIDGIYDYLLDQIEKEINGFYTKYANAEGITMAEAKKRVSKLDIEAYERKAEKYVKNKDFSSQANAEMRLYNATMKINRLEMLKANIGLEMVDSFDELQKYFDDILTQRTLDEFERQAGILGESIKDNAKAAHSIVNASFNNATFSDRIWMYQDMLKSELSSLLAEGLIQGRHPNVLARHLQKRFGVQKSYAERLMRTELARVQIEAQKQSYENGGFDQYMFIATHSARTCPVCAALDGKVFDIKSMVPATNAPPMHPNCRCSTAAYMDRAQSEEELEENGLYNMSTTRDKIKWPEKAKKISQSQYKELSEYARDRGIGLEGFKQFDGDMQVIKQAIDDADEIAVRFPEIKTGKKKITISLDENMDPDDFAVTRGHIIHVNADAFRNVDTLSKEYDILAREGCFVKGTNYRSIIKHETGHVVANIYGIDSMEIAMDITGNSRKEVMRYSEFSLRFMEACVKIKEKRK